MPRKEKKAVKLPTTGLVAVGAVCFFFAAACSGFLWNKAQIHELGQQMRQYETRLEDAKRRRMTLERIYAEMCSPVGLAQRVKRMNLEIGPPQPDQLVRLAEPNAGTEEKLLAQRASQKGEQGRN
jgi:hypothetical protein